MGLDGIMSLTYIHLNDILIYNRILQLSIMRDFLVKTNNNIYNLKIQTSFYNRNLMSVPSIPAAKSVPSRMADQCSNSILAAL